MTGHVLRYSRVSGRSCPGELLEMTPGRKMAVGPSAECVHRLHEKNIVAIQA